MCGIAGYLSRRGEQSWPDFVLERMTASIGHRGPDDRGFYRDNHAALGHRRLSIIDLATGSQPMANEDESLWIVYNGEIFNHAGLRPALERGGHRYRSCSDTETILHAFEQHGAACLDLFRGMFAFAIWDRVHHRLFCARDRLGIKPFYYYWDGSLFAFASEIKALLEHPALSPALEESVLPERLDAFLQLGEVVNRCHCHGVASLPHGDCEPILHVAHDLSNRRSTSIHLSIVLQHSEAGRGRRFAGDLGEAELSF